MVAAVAFPATVAAATAADSAHRVVGEAVLARPTAEDHSAVRTAVAVVALRMAAEAAALTEVAEATAAIAKQDFSAS